MTAALTPVLALAYLRELSADVRAGIVLDAQGNALASIGDGDPRVAAGGLAAAARALLSEAALVRARTGDGGVFGASDDRHGVVVATGPLALPGLTLHDLRSVLAALGGTPPHGPVSEASPAAAAALLDAL